MATAMPKMMLRNLKLKFDVTKKIVRKIIKARKYTLGIDKNIKITLNPSTTLNLYFNGIKNNRIQENNPNTNKKNSA